MKLNRKWLLVIALVMSLTMATAGTLAFLTDHDSEVNTFTLGNVDIDLVETYEPNSQLNPGVEVTKEAKIVNVHATEPAYVWMVVSVPEALDDYIELNWVDEYANSVIKLDDDDVTKPYAGYTSYVVKYPTALDAKDKAPLNEVKLLEGVKLDSRIDYDNEAKKYCIVENGVPTYIDVPNVKNIYVDAYAIQTQGFEDGGVEAAYAAYTAQWGSLMKPVESVTVSKPDDLKNAVTAGSNADITLSAPVELENLTIGADSKVTLDLNNNTITTAGGLLNMGGDLVVENGTLSDSSTSGYGARTEAGATTTYNNVHIETKAGGVNVWGTAVFNSGSVVNNSLSTSPRHVFYVATEEGHLTINGGEFTFSPENLTRKGSYICAEGGATVIVNGGTFGKPSTRTAPIQALSGATVTIYGGRFEFDPSAFVAEGYAATKGDDGYWTVAPVVTP